MSDTTGSPTPTSQHAEENRTVTAPNHPFRPDLPLPPETMDMFRQLVAAVLDIPPWAVGVSELPPPRRLRLATHIGQAGWELAHVLSRTGRWLDRAGDRVINAGDWLATKVAGPAGA